MGDDGSSILIVSILAAGCMCVCSILSSAGAYVGYDNNKFCKYNSEWGKSCPITDDVDLGNIDTTTTETTVGNVALGNVKISSAGFNLIRTTECSKNNVRWVRAENPIPNKYSAAWSLTDVQNNNATITRTEACDAGKPTFLVKNDKGEVQLGTAETTWQFVLADNVVVSPSQSSSKCANFACYVKNGDKPMARKTSKKNDKGKTYEMATAGMTGETSAVGVQLSTI
jgi:hypothetical protein